MNKNTLNKASKNLIKFKQFFRQRWGHSLLLSIASTVLTAIPVDAAERIYFYYGALNLSVRVGSLEAYARDGTINKELEFYLSRVSPEQQALFREALRQSYDINPVLLSRFFNTTIGEEILSTIGNLVQIQGGRNGKYALRGALVQAAFEPEGLTVLNFLRKFPTNIQFNGEQIFAFRDALTQVVNTTTTLVGIVGQLSAQAAATEPPINFSTLADIRQPGPFGVEQQSFILTDESRNREFQVYLYKPQRWRLGKAPVVVISHGLASRPEDFSKLAEHLASYGYVVALPQHPGSDLTQVQNLLAGFSGEIFILNEFIDRPFDISDLLDELERRNQTEFEGRLNLKEVGVFGHSFGGYTALALAGAEIDFKNLEKDCQRQFGYLNTSLLLQCRALDLPRKLYHFRDNRVKAVIATNPVNSSIFGPTGLGKIQIPVMLGAGSYDPATPAVFEQIRCFPWLKTPDKYLALSEGQAHVDFSQLDAGITQLIDSIPNLTLPDPELLDNYVNSISLAFFEVYIAHDDDYRPYLSSSYAQYISEEPFNLYLLDSSWTDELMQALKALNIDIFTITD